MAKNITYDNVIQCLIEKIPEFKPIYEEHIDQNDGEVLNHVLMGDLVRFTEGVCSSISASPTSITKELLQRIVDFLEEAISSDDSIVVEMINVSFLENLHQLKTRENYELLKQKMGKETLKHLAIVEPVWLNRWLNRL
jgi:hypothetical protein